MHFIMYVDESGDPGGNHTPGGPTDYFALTGFIIDINAWNYNYNIYKDLRRTLKGTYGLKSTQELHGRLIVRNKKEFHYLNLTKAKTYNIYSDVLNSVRRMRDVYILSVFLEKANPNVQRSVGYFNGDIEELAWNRLAMRYQTFMDRTCDGNFGMVIPDRSRVKSIKENLRKWRVYNIQLTFSGGRNFPLFRIIEDPFFKDSKEAPFIQLTDMINFSMVMRENVRRNGPGKNRFKKINGHILFDRLKPLLILQASRTDPDGIIRR